MKTILHNNPAFLRKSIHSRGFYARNTIITVKRIIAGKVPTGGGGLRRHASFSGLARGREGA